jgi:hypothetical protein
MPKLTSTQAFDLAQSFHSLAVQIGNYRFDNFDDLTRPQRKQLEDLEFDVLNDSTKFNALSIDLSLNDLEDTLSQIDDATIKMQNAIKSIKRVERVINIGTAAVTLGAAIVSMNPGAIASAISGVIDAVS